MKYKTFLTLYLSLTLTSHLFPQVGAFMTSRLSEPPELSGPGKVPIKPSAADAQLFEIIGHLNKEDEVKSSLPSLDEFINAHPDYSDALFLRATCKACILGSHDFNSIQHDVKAAMEHPGQVYNSTDYFSLLGKIELANGNYAQAVDNLEKAMLRDLDSASRMFNIDGVEPEKASKFCVWNLTDLDRLRARFPKDYRVSLFRGLYYEFFTTFKEDYYPNAMQEFQKAVLLNPRSPLPQYFIGQLYSQASFWTKKAWASDEDRDNRIRNAARAYSNAIQLNSAFLPAYEQRASDYLNLKQYQRALGDYDRILVLDPENVTAYADRGLAKLESGNNWGAISDFGDAIRLKTKDAQYLPTLHENRGDAYVKVGRYRDAITDYSKAIELSFGQMTILLSLKQIRGLYPELNEVSDDALCHKLHDLFYPNVEYAGFAKRLMEQNQNWAISTLNELYEKRGDAYLKAGNYERGTLDLMRIFRGIPNFAESTDRWRLLGTTADKENYFLDTKSAEFPSNGPVHLWIKMVGAKESRTVEYELDCKTRRMNEASILVYDPNGRLLNSSEMSSGWQGVVPDTIGEQIYNGACSAAVAY